MRQPISWADLAGRTVAVWGLGAEGRANIRTLQSLGVEALLVNDTPVEPPVDAQTVLVTAEGGLDAMLAADVVIKSPGISRHRAEVAELETAGVAVVGGLGLWLAGVDRSKVLCITGTKGKSTTTAIVTHLAAGLGLNAVAGGNIGAPPWDPAAQVDAESVDLWVIEVSSYQAADLAVGPPVVVVTSLSPDHLPWHGSEEQYYRDKLSLTTRPGVELTIASGDSPLLVDRQDLIGQPVRWVDAESFDAGWAEPLGLIGRHNVVNAQIARAALAAVGIAGADDDVALRRAASGFGGLESRLQLIGTVDGVDFIDDGLSTNVLPTIAAIEAMGERPVALIAGGFDRDIDYEPLAIALAQRTAPTLVLTAYQTGPRIAAEIAANPGTSVDVVQCADLDDAVRRGHEWADDGGVVLLSPAAASFDAFDDYRHRSRVFAEAMHRLES